MRTETNNKIDLTTTASKDAEGIYIEPVEKKIEWDPKNQVEKVGVEIVHILNKADGQAYFAGGYARDLAIDRFYQNKYEGVKFEPHDIDIATNLKYNQVKQILKESKFSQDIKFKETGTHMPVLNIKIKIKKQNIGFEIASFRKDVEYDKNSRQAKTEHTSEIKEDAQRRDFKINGMYFDPENKKIIDYVGGLEDLNNREINFIGDANERIKEDPLRMYRYVRFRHKFNLKRNKSAEKAIQDNIESDDIISAERLAGEDRGELNKIFQSPRVVHALIDLTRLGLLKKRLPEVYSLIYLKHTPKGKESEIHQEGDVFRHTLEVIRAVSRPEFIELLKNKLDLDQNLNKNQVIEKFYHKYGFGFNWACILHDIGKQKTQKKSSDEKRYTFYGHAKKSLELITGQEKKEDKKGEVIKKDEEAQQEEEIRGIASKERLNFSKKLSEQIKFLVKNHMMIYSIIDNIDTITTRGMGTKQRNTFASAKVSQIESLLWLGLADRFGNIRTNSNKNEEIKKFNQAWDYLHQFKEKEGDADKQRLNKKTVNRLTQQIFDVNSGIIIGIVNKAVEYLLGKNKIDYDDEGFIIENQVKPIVEKIKKIIDQQNIEIKQINIDDLNQILEKVKQGLSDY